MVVSGGLTLLPYAPDFSLLFYCNVTLILPWNLLRFLLQPFCLVVILDFFISAFPSTTGFAISCTTQTNTIHSCFGFSILLGPPYLVLSSSHCAMHLQTISLQRNFIWHLFSFQSFPFVVCLCLVCWWCSLYFFCFVLITNHHTIKRCKTIPPVTLCSVGKTLKTQSGSAHSLFKVSQVWIQEMNSCILV